MRSQKCIFQYELHLRTTVEMYYFASKKSIRPQFFATSIERAAVCGARRADAGARDNRTTCSISYSMQVAPPKQKTRVHHQR